MTITKKQILKNIRYQNKKRCLKKYSKLKFNDLKEYALKHNVISKSDLKKEDKKQIFNNMMMEFKKEVTKPKYKKLANNSIKSAKKQLKKYETIVKNRKKNKDDFDNVNDDDEWDERIDIILNNFMMKNSPYYKYNLSMRKIYRKIVSKNKGPVNIKFKNFFNKKLNAHIKKSRSFNNAISNIKHIKVYTKKNNYFPYMNL